MAKNEDWIATGLALLLGYAVMKAVTNKRCQNCGNMTPRDKACRHCGGWP